MLLLIKIWKTLKINAHYTVSSSIAFNTTNSKRLIVSLRNRNNGEDILNESLIGRIYSYLKLSDIQVLLIKG